MPKHVPITVRFGQRIRALRLARGLSQERLAELAGLDRTYVSGIERGLRNVALRNIEALAEALGVPIATLKDRSNVMPATAERSRCRTKRG